MSTGLWGRPDELDHRQADAICDEIRALIEKKVAEVQR